MAAETPSPQALSALRGPASASSSRQDVRLFSLKAIFYLALVMLLLIAHSARAADTEIQVKHIPDVSDTAGNPVAVEATRIYKSDDGVLQTPVGLLLSTSPTLDVRKDNKVVVSIVNRNPLLFQYTLKKGAAKQTSNQKELQKFADVLTPTKAATGGNEEFTERLFKERLRMVLGAEGEEATKPPLATVAAYTSCADALTEFLRFEGELKGFAGQRSDLVKKSLSNPLGTRTEVRGWPRQDWDKRSPILEDKIVELLDKAAKSTAPTDPQCEKLHLLKVDALNHILKELDDFADVASDIGKPVILDPFTVDIANDQPIEITVAKTKNFPEDLQTTAFLGNATFTISPESRVKISVAAAAVYSFVRNPTFTAKAAGDHFIIEQSSNPYNELDLAAMMVLEPQAWDLGPVNFGMQLGVTPKKDLGFLLGLSLRANNLFTFGAGIAFQKVSRLKVGLSVGQTIATQDALKTDTEFRTGLYIHVTLAPKSKS